MNAATLKNVPLLSGLDDKQLEQIAKSMRERRVSAGDTLVEQGAGGVGFFVIEEGEAEVTVDGEPKATLGPGDYLGEIALLTDSTRTATVTAKTDLLCWGMTSWDFKPLVEGNADIAWKILSTMATRVN